MYLRMIEDLVVVAALESLVPEKVNLLKFVEKTETIRFVPADRKNVKTDLAPYAIRETEIRELFS